MASKYRVGVIGHTGHGNYGHGLADVWRKVADCELVGLADADEAGRAKTAAQLKAPAAFADYRELLDKTKPQIVAIGPRWPDQHRDMVLACAERGIHIYLEKPLCRNLTEADEMVAAIEKHNVKLALAHQTRYSPKLGVIREMIDDGLLGTVLELRGRGKEDKRGGGEDLWVLGSHVFNLMQYFGGEPNWCFAEVLVGDRPITKADVKPGNEALGPLAGDNLSAMYGLDGGAHAYFSSRREAGIGASRFGLQIYGSKGIVEVLTGSLPEVWFLPDPNWSPGRSKKAWQPVSSQGLGQPEVLADGGLDGGNLLAVYDLLEAIEEDRQPE
ncbi:MAG TPA: Gfo/Idh/MocA family oxidoreductase, partial [Pirellulaceae bacterium]|nr:Gfo/Idh/MocA family oxidoreductase [Pirellulaceae bacterium]